MGEYKTLYDELSSLKKENRELKAQNEVMRKIIDSYYQEDKHDVNKYLAKAKEQKELSEGAKNFVKYVCENLERGETNEQN